MDSSRGGEGGYPLCGRVVVLGTCLTKRGPDVVRRTVEATGLEPVLAGGRNTGLFQLS